METTGNLTAKALPIISGGAFYSLLPHDLQKILIYENLVILLANQVIMRYNKIVYFNQGSMQNFHYGGLFMCGFVGFTNLQNDSNKIIEEMMNKIIHRGPDSGGKYIDGDIALGFRRLSIIDISSSGDQPIYNEDKTKVLLFNGEIYNYQIIREELVKAGHKFRTNTDSEVLIHG